MHVHWPGLIAMIGPGRLPCMRWFVRWPVRSSGSAPDSPSGGPSYRVNSAQTTLPVSRPASGCQPQLSL